LCRLNLKFGASLVAVPSLLAKAKELGLNVVGVSFHVGSGCFDSSAFSDAIRRSRAAFDMGKEAGYEFSILDIGGGFEDATFDATALTISDAIDTYFPDRTGAGLRIIAEPGRYFVRRPSVWRLTSLPVGPPLPLRVTWRIRKIQTLQVSDVCSSCSLANRC
jgi:ornithine decarboxylase